ncbi:MAG: zinc ribbon domain-containing protein [Sulfurimonadaceae bacterium]|jgi:uncharacterized membrane protein YvbJ|nr:zinc ribbon domain-containing protein [Sulfurimonadaceae bacterium]
MALIECPECKNQVSEYALTCPNCGTPIARTEENKSDGDAHSTKQELNKKFKLYTIISSVLFWVGIIVFLINFKNNNESNDLKVVMIASASLAIIGLVWYLVTKVRTWWNNR